MLAMNKKERGGGVSSIHPLLSSVSSVARRIPTLGVEMNRANWADVRSNCSEAPGSDCNEMRGWFSVQHSQWVGGEGV